MAGVLGELGALAWSRPGMGASAAEVAAWYERKALMLEHVVAESGAESDRAAAWAVSAHEHAAALVGGIPSQGKAFAMPAVLIEAA